MQKTAFELQPNLIRLALGIPTAGVGGLMGYLTAPKTHRWDGAARGAGIGYMAGTGAGVGTLLGDAAAPGSNTGGQNVPYALAGGLAGGVAGLGVGQMMQGPTPWEQRRKFREELLAALREEQRGLNKTSEENSRLTNFAADNPELAIIPIAGGVGANLAEKKDRPITNALRGLLTGAATGAGAIGGAALGRRMTDDPSIGTFGGGALGGLLSYLLTRRTLSPGREKVSVGPVLSQLLEAKQLSDRRDYKGKYARLRSLIEQYPDDFYIDSVQGDMAGITHRPTGFKIHSPMRVLPVRLRGFANAEPGTP